MEKFYIKSDFENFLKNSVEDFIMIPQRKVWFGIYNHLHPEKKWPSIAAALVILVSILHIGITNNKTVNKNHLIAFNKIQQAQNTITNNSTINNISTKSELPTKFETTKTKYTPNTSNQNNSTHYLHRNVKSNYHITISKEQEVFADASNETTQSLSNANIQIIKVDEQNNLPNIDLAIENNIKTTVEKNTTIKTTTTENINEVAQIQLPKKSSKNSINYYLTPSIGYRSLYEKNLRNKVGSSFRSTNLSTSPTSISNINIDDEKAVNVEFGAIVEHPLKNNYTFVIGAQINYTNYISNVSDLKHPTQNTIAVNTVQPFVSMDYETTPGKIKLNKSTLQVSIPVGLHKKLIGNENIAWYVGANLQPSFTFAGNAYVLSNDTKNYSNQKDLLRRFNLNAAAETFLSIKTANGIHFNVGPQIRGQILSTYKNNYNYSEKLYNFGLKIGVSTKF